MANISIGQSKRNFIFINFSFGKDAVRNLIPAGVGYNRVCVLATLFPLFRLANKPPFSLSCLVSKHWDVDYFFANYVLFLLIACRS